jgi:serine/threonine-protein kinase
MMETLGRYKILSTIGQGAMGMVYKAVDPMIDRTVAIKAIHLTLNDEEMAEYEARFQQEIKAVGRLNHPNIVTIYDVGRSGNITYMAMEFLEGRELSDILADAQRPSIAKLVGWIIQIAQALELAHENEIVHRDVKPSNIMVVRGDFAKITDFGIARMPASAVKTMTGMILGSPRYMSPEQVTGADLDNRTDIFSLGVVLYEALAGRWPFDGSNITAIMYSTVNLVPPPPSSLNSEVPVMLDLIVAKALAKNTEDRYQSMRDFAQDLMEVQRQLSASGNSPQVLAATTSSRPANPAPATVVKPASYQAPNDHDETGQPLKLSKAFDSFEATVKLAALTNQTPEFSHYISETQQMRKYQGAPADSAVGATTQRVIRETASQPQAFQASTPAKPAARNGDRSEDMPPAPSPQTNLAPIAVLFGLALLAIVLTIMLVTR